MGSNAQDIVCIMIWIVVGIAFFVRQKRRKAWSRPLALYCKGKASAGGAEESYNHHSTAAVSDPFSDEAPIVPGVHANEQQASGSHPSTDNCTSQASSSKGPAPPYQATNADDILHSAV